MRHECSDGLKLALVVAALLVGGCGRSFSGAACVDDIDCPVDTVCSPEGECVVPTLADLGAWGTRPDVSGENPADASGPEVDGGRPADSGADATTPRPDATTTPDEGVDGGNEPDGGGGADAAGGDDAGPEVDAGPGEDGGAGSDAGPAPDGGPGEDGGAGDDAGSDGGGDPPADSGPGSDTSPRTDGGPDCVSDDPCVTARWVDAECVRVALICEQDANPCTRHQCDSAQGGCVPVAVLGDCRDLNSCNGVERCVAGECVAGEPVVCPQDNNPCTRAACDPGSGVCRAEPTAGDCRDADACNGVERCEQGVCRPGLAVECPQDDNPCTRNECDAAQGICGPVHLIGACADADPCNGVEQCDHGVCLPAEPVACAQDDNPCTHAECDPQSGGCSTVAVAGECGDGDACNGTEACVAGACVHGDPVQCQQGLVCVDGECVGGCGGHCDCPQGHTCSEGVCSPEPNGGYCCESDGCPLGASCRFVDGRLGLCGGTINFDVDLAGRALDPEVDVQSLYVGAGVELSTQREGARVMTNPYELASASGNNSCATKDEGEPFGRGYWMGDIVVHFVMRANGELRQAATHSVSLYVGNTWSNGLAVEFFGPDQAHLGTVYTDSSGTDYVQVASDEPIGWVRVRPNRDPDFTLDDLSFGPLYRWFD